MFSNERTSRPLKENPKNCAKSRGSDEENPKNCTKKK
jgi:hypothetical protein